MLCLAAIPNLPLSLAAFAGMLALCLSVGSVLVPLPRGHGHSIFRTGVCLASGMLFVTGVSATWCLGRMHILSVFPVLQSAAAFFLWRQTKTDTAAPAADCRDFWHTAVTMVATALIVAILPLPGHDLGANGAFHDIYEDQGFYSQQVLGIPESGVASLWSGVLGAHAIEACQVNDVWYHWGPMFLAIGIKAATGLPAFVALLDVTRWLMDTILLIVAAAIVRSLCRVSSPAAVVIAGLSFLASQLAKFEFVKEWMGEMLPFGAEHHYRAALGLWFSYKYEAITMLSAIAAWQHQRTAASLLFLLLGAVSAPHTVAAVGPAAAALAVVGLLLRNGRIWRTGAAMTGTLLAGWLLVRLCGSDMPKAEDQSYLNLNPAALVPAIGRGMGDSMVGLALGAVSIPGLAFLIRSRSESGHEQARLLGWFALAGIPAAYAAYHLLAGATDSFHIIYLFHAVIVVPAGFWGAVCMVRSAENRTRLLGLAAVAAMVAMGAYDAAAYRLRRTDTLWRISDIQTLKSELKGRPFGYFAAHDRGWWIPKLGVLASLMDSRCVRLNATMADANSPSSRFYGFTAPFSLVPLREDEDGLAWSLRFAKKLGIRHVLSMPQNPLPKEVKSLCRPVVAAPGLFLCELPEEIEMTSRPLAQPAARTPPQQP